jgi:hypothetical protein
MLRSLRLDLTCALWIAIASASVARPAAAAPEAWGTRNLSLGDAYRASASGPSAYLGDNAAGMSSTRMLAFEPVYQVGLARSSHSFGVVAMDSMNSGRIALGLGYLALMGAPQLRYADEGGAAQALTMARRGHELGLGLAVNVIRGWLSLGIRTKYQNLSLRYEGADGALHDAAPRLNAFGVDLSAHLNLFGYVSVAVIGTNLSGVKRPDFTEARPLDLRHVEAAAGSLDLRELSRVSEYPRGFAHAVSVFPLRRRIFSVNLDGAYDFTSYRDQEHTRLRYAASSEVYVGKVVLRAGGGWDRRGPGRADDRAHVAGGVALMLSPTTGRTGLDVGVGFLREVVSPAPETYLGVNVGLRFDPGF